MSIFDKTNLSVNLRPGITACQPIIPRRYTLTHSDQTGQLFLSVALQYATDEITPSRDEVLAEWRCLGPRNFQLHAYVCVDNHSGKKEAALRNKHFIRRLPLALGAIFCGDRYFFYNRPELHMAPVWIHFQSCYPEFCRDEYWGVMAEYANSYSRKI
ncbi:staygreen protein [Anaerospora hongkongensis]|uniref:Staygreen protein n=1 Tax=Anaerospora hongkongensis TaxID=244830 RepID=A0A4R1Q1P2_9FIRM|nr:staygreen family protein [Anaerospora hongkongensis]TCL38248.1 staygreen protein [Anaerospora hongkongensis]